MKNKVSVEVQEQSLKAAKGTQKPGQNKEQTKLIAQGIAKGIAEYKKQQSKKSRERDKLQKAKSRQQNQAPADTSREVSVSEKQNILPWVLLLFSWLAFAGYLYFLN
jgi:hypothetical protein